MSIAVPRVNAAWLSTYVGETVRLIGKVSEVKKEQISLLTSDHQIVTVTVKDSSVYNLGSIYEVKGKVERSGEVCNLEEQANSKLTDNFAMDVLEDYIQVAHSLPALFGTKPPQ